MSVASMVALRQLADRYAPAIDPRDLDTVVQPFVDDVRVAQDRTGRDLKSRPCLWSDVTGTHLNP